MSSDEDGAALMAAFKKNGAGGRPSIQSKAKRVSLPPRLASEPSTIAESEDAMEDAAPPTPRRAVGVIIPIKHIKKSDYTYYEPTDEVEEVLREYSKRGDMMYEVRSSESGIKQITFEQLLESAGGPEALQRFQPDEDPNATDLSGDEDDMKLRKKKAQTKKQDYIDLSTINISSSEDERAPSAKRTRNGRMRSLAQSRDASGRSSRTRSHRSEVVELSTSEDDDNDDDDSDAPTRKRRRRRKQPPEPTRRSSRQQAQVEAMDDSDEEDDEDDDKSSGSDILRSDVLLGGRRKQRSQQSGRGKARSSGVRQSERSTRAMANMEEAGMEDVYRSDSEPKVAAPKLTQVREVFETLPRNDLFRSRHAAGCEVCFDGANVTPLIYCQGCSQAYHKNCLGNRSTREHLATKVDDDRFVLQCKRCINMYQKKDPNAPDLSKCQDCAQFGASCKPFRKRKTTQQEMKEREENDGQDPIVDVAPELINNAHNVLFRCTKCSRAWHYHHLPPLSQYAMDVNREDEELAEERFREYSSSFHCKECEDTAKLKVGGIIAWRPSDLEIYRPGTSCDKISEDDKQYFIKWENQSYFRAAWFSGAWTWGVTAHAMRKAFFKKEDGPKMRTEDAIPEEYLRIDIVLDIKYNNYVEINSEEIDKARIKEVDKALIKYKGLGYEDAVWETVPSPDDGDQWLDFVTAYNDWVAGRYVKYPKQGPLKARLDKARGLPFAKLERSQQPDNLVGGELMKYQIDGLNWLYYQWYSQNNGILADEMGLGKTIQVIAFMATLIQEHNCFPFLIVVPNSTAANWRREIKQWVPSLRVVAYFGSAQARDMAYKYEMYPQGTKELRCHIVVTSYEAASDDGCRRMFRSVNWGGLIVDEGQRLKNDKSQLYTALSAVKAPFRLLMTGTPLQNNARELFNLLQFLDETIDAAALEEKYAEMTSENIKELHDKIRPYILRRTKAQVLGFLPPLAQVILPISMSHLQKTVYRSILSKKPELLHALFTASGSLQQTDRANLSNILMQLRKCLCHPFVYSCGIEERTEIPDISHRNLVEASAKLSLLELLLPKLQANGHRVLIFSQFLDMLDIIEDFLDGMQMPHQRLDGQMGSLEKQKRIDQFNAPDSTLFAFLLSTRAGGVGINLATADTVIILDPDWNPHQDLQAIARAHRIGQKKKVLCFQLMTRGTVEEKIIQMGRKKMALDHVVVESLDAKDEEDHDVESILKFGAAELFKDDNDDQDIRYDDASIAKLLDRSEIENTKTNANDDSAESQFSFARVWANDTGTLQNELDPVEDTVAPNKDAWEKILRERLEKAAAAQARQTEMMGRGRRARGQVDYATEKDEAAPSSAAAEDAFEDALALPSPVKTSNRRKKKQADSESDTDYRADTEDESEPDVEPKPEDLDAEKELGAPAGRSTITIPKHTPSKQNGAGPIQAQSLTPSRHSQLTVTSRTQNLSADRSKPPSDRAILPTVNVTPVPKRSSNVNSAVKPFKRAQLPVRNPMGPVYPPNSTLCHACREPHPVGACQLKAAGVEHCGLCGLAHYGQGRTCPHIRSETQVRDMLLALKSSNEARELVDLATKYLRGVKGTLVQQKKRDKEKAAAANGTLIPQPSTIARPSKAGQHVAYAPTAPMNGAGAPAVSGQQGGPRQREVPTWYERGSVIQAQQQRKGLSQMRAQGHMSDQDVASALQGYLQK